MTVPGARFKFETAPLPPLDAVPMPMLVTRQEFRQAVLLAEARGCDPRTYLGWRPVLVHPDSLRWYMERLALYRMREHFGMLS